MTHDSHALQSNGAPETYPHLDERGLCVCECRDCYYPDGPYFGYCTCPDRDAEQCGCHA